MEDLKLLKCKTCGEPLDLSTAHDGVITCGVCGGTYILPKEDSSPEVRFFLSQGEHDLDTGKFDDAYSAFAKAAEKDATEPEAYWGMALAKNGIQYLLDEKVENIIGGNGKRLQPICHRIDDEKFTDDPYYNRALDCATPDQRTEYEKRATEIDHIKREFYRLKQTGLDYDCFICVKVSKNAVVTDPSAKTEETEKTEDSEFAHQIYRMLKNHSYVPFYSEAVLSDETGADYEAHILYALATSETMLVICFDKTYLDTKWVKNEYTRFLKLVNDDEKESDSIAIVYKGNAIEKLPGKKGKIQGIDAGSIDYSHRILNFVHNHTPETQRKRAEAKQRAEEEAKRREEEARQRAEELNKLREDVKRRDEDLKQLREEIKIANRSQTETVVSGSTIENNLTLAREEIKLEHYDKAEYFYREILKIDTKHPIAWFGIMMLGLDCHNDDELAEKLIDNDFFDMFNTDKTVNKVKSVADSAIKERFNRLFDKRKQVLEGNIKNAENEIKIKQEKIAEAENKIDEVNSGIDHIQSQINDINNGELNEKQAELVNFNAVLSEKRKEAAPHQKAADSAIRKKNGIHSLDHTLVGEEFLSDFWLDEGADFTLANIFGWVLELADDVRDFISDSDIFILFKPIFYLLWLAGSLLGIIVVMTPVILVMGLLSLLILSISIPVNLFIVVFNLIGNIRKTKLENKAKIAQKQANDILCSPEANVMKCNIELSEIRNKIENLSIQIKTNKKQIGNYYNQIGDYDNNISSLNRQINGWKESLAKC